MQKINIKKEVSYLLQAKPRFLYMFAILLNAVLGCYVLENVAFFNEESFVLNNNFEFYMVFVAAVLSNISLLFFVHKYEKIKLDIAPFLVCFVCLLGNCIGILTFPSNASISMQTSENNIISFVFDLDIFQKIRYGLLFCLAIHYAYMIFAVYPKLIKSSSSFSFIFFGIVFVAIFSIAWSFVFEWDVYVKYFNKEDLLTSSDFVGSFYNNRNTFGAMLLLGICSCGFLQCRRHCFIHYFIMLIFYVELYFVVSKTSIVLSSIFLLIFLLYRFILTIKRRPIKTIICSILVIGLPTLLVCFGAFNVFGDNSIFSKLYDNFILSFDFANVPSLESRTLIWKALLSFLLAEPSRIIFGIGEYTPNLLLANAFSPLQSGYFYAHNGLLQLFASGGIIRLLCVAFFYFAFLFKAIKNMCNKKSISFLFILIFVVFSLHGLTESTYFFPCDTKGFALCFVTFLPVFVDYKGLNEKTNEMAMPFRKTKIKYFHSSLSKTSLLLSFILPIFIFFGGIYLNIDFALSISTSFNYYFAIFCLVSPLFLFLCFYCSFSIKKKSSLIYLILSLLFVSFGAVTCFFFNSPISFFVFFSLLLLYTIYLFFRSRKYLKNENHSKIWFNFLGLFIYLALAFVLNYLPLSFLDFKTFYSLSYLMGLIVANLFLYLCYIFFPRKKSIIAPLDLKIYVLSLRVSYFLNKMEAKRMLREDKYFKRNDFSKIR
ncbi:MAG TPA: hypothetical protein DCR94_05760 [Firmicutes bacterium]|nr:hypothetical protein [Bacillota bacterium]